MLSIIDRTCFDMGWDALSLVFDGAIVEKSENIASSELGDVLRAAEVRCGQAGWQIKLAVKPLHGLHQVAADPPKTVTEARDALRAFEQRVG